MAVTSKSVPSGSKKSPTIIKPLRPAKIGKKDVKRKTRDMNPSGSRGGYLTR